MKRLIAIFIQTNDDDDNNNEEIQEIISKKKNVMLYSMALNKMDPTNKKHIRDILK